jgi:hypothetical protein
MFVLKSITCSDKELGYDLNVQVINEDEDEDICNRVFSYWIEKGSYCCEHYGVEINGVEINGEEPDYEKVAKKLTRKFKNYIIVKVTGRSQACNEKLTVLLRKPSDDEENENEDEEDNEDEDEDEEENENELEIAGNVYNRFTITLFNYHNGYYTHSYGCVYIKENGTIKEDGGTI